ncbi:DtxR family transcriptional regulator [Listeria grayi FSL F6-1183]|uniref:DtxR family transcriptional regulator n=1 Tax=Listeria grayi FSL F6-1183 TaxID=1265827 RepID=A0A829R6D1_LISGR|nr:DtxR family transcriptional regulator [Listeria grayi FSL F6-1183]
MSWNSIDRIGDVVQYFEENEAAQQKLKELQAKQGE